MDLLGGWRDGTGGESDWMRTYRPGKSHGLNINWELSGLMGTNQDHISG